MNRFCQKLLIIIIAAIFVSCGSKSDIQEVPLQIKKQFGGANVADEAILTLPKEMIITNQRELIISDAGENQIILFDLDGNVMKRIGRKGQGPGELNSPYSLFAFGDTIVVYELGNNRIQYLSKNGEPLFDVKCKFDPGISTPAFNEKGEAFLPTGGFRNKSLIRHFNSKGEELDAIGNIEGEGFDMFQMAAIRDAFIEKKIPPSYKNAILIRLSPSGDIYAIFQTLPLIKVYSPNGNLLKTIQLKIKEFEGIKNRYSKLNAKFKEEGSSGFYPISFWKDAEFMENGDLILLLNNPDQMLLYQMSGDGQITGKYSGVEDEITMMAVQGNDLLAFGRDTHIFYLYGI